MPRQYPHRITKKKLLKFGLMQMEVDEIKKILYVHDRATKVLLKQGWTMDPKTRELSPPPTPKTPQLKDKQ